MSSKIAGKFIFYIGAYILLLWLGTNYALAATTQTLNGQTNVSAEVKQANCLGEVVNNPSSIVYPYPIICETTNTGARIVEPNLGESSDSQSVQKNSSLAKRFNISSPFSSFENLIEGNLSKSMIVISIIAILVILAVLRAAGYLSARKFFGFFRRKD